MCEGPAYWGRGHPWAVVLDDIKRNLNAFFSCQVDIKGSHIVLWIILTHLLSPNLVIIYYRPDTRLCVPWSLHGTHTAPSLHTADKCRLHVYVKRWAIILTRSKLWDVRTCWDSYVWKPFCIHYVVINRDNFPLNSYPLRILPPLSPSLCLSLLLH